MQLKTFAICIIVLMATAAAGCVLMPAPSAPTATPTVTPMASAVVPTQWPPSTIGTITSGQVSVKDVKVSYNRNEASGQSENFSILLENSGRTWANNTFISLRVTDSFTDNFLYASPQIEIGNIPPRTSKWVNVTTASHPWGFSVLLEMEWYWGDLLEFHNTFKKAYTIAPIDYEHLNG